MSRRATVVFSVAITLALLCQRVGAQLTQTQEVYEQAINALFREDVDVRRPHVLYVFKSSATLERLPDTSYQARQWDRTGSRTRWGDVPRQLRDSLHEILSRGRALVVNTLLPGVQWRDDKDYAGIVLSVSSVAFAPDTSQAVVYVAVHCGPICGGADIIFLRKAPSGRWEVAATFPIWRS